MVSFFSPKQIMSGYISHKLSLFLLNFLIFFSQSIYLDIDSKYLIPRSLIPHIFFIQFISSLNSIMFSFGYCFTDVACNVL